MQINFVQTTWTHSNTIDFGSIPVGVVQYLLAARSYREEDAHVASSAASHAGRVSRDRKTSFITPLHAGQALGAGGSVERRVEAGGWGGTPRRAAAACRSWSWSRRGT